MFIDLLLSNFEIFILLSILFIVVAFILLFLLQFQKSSFDNTQFFIPIDSIVVEISFKLIMCFLKNINVGYEDVFSEQLAVSGRKGDVLIALSGSGNSPNVIKALNMANSLKMETVAVLGFDGGKCKNLATIPIHFPINDMQIAEDLQLVVGHMTMRWIEAQIKKSG